MKIGIDIDGCLTDIEQWQFDYGSKFFYENFKKKIVYPAAYDSIEIFDALEEEDNAFWYRYFVDYSMHIEPRKFASEILKKLKSEGNEIIIITARGSFLTKPEHISRNKKIVLNWLQQYHICYDKIIFTKEDKVDICVENGIQLMIEDKKKNINQISEKVPVICFHAGYNADCQGHNIYRCYSWYDIYANLEEIRNRNV